MWLTLAAMRNGIAILMASLAIVLLGATSLGRMPIDLFPNLNYPSLQVGTIYKGASAQDIERSVTYPIEKAVSAVANVRYVESRSRQGFSAVTVQFAWGADIDAGLTEVMQRIQAIMSTLPTGIQQPFILKFDLSNIPVCIITVAGGGGGGRRGGAGFLAPPLQHDRAADRAPGRGRFRQRGWRQDPPDHRHPRPRPPLRQGPVRQRSDPRRQRRELPPPLGRRQARELRLQRLHQQPVLGGRSHGGHRGAPHRHHPHPAPGRGPRGGLGGDPGLHRARRWR